VLDQPPLERAEAAWFNWQRICGEFGNYAGHLVGLYWIRLYRDDAEWRIARRSFSMKSMTAELCWFLFDDDPVDADLEYYDTEINEVGPEIVPPQL
jgi:hypothetical protein